MQIALASDFVDIRERTAALMVALLAATGSVVFIEPAPYDLLAIAMFVGFVAAGLRFPRGMQIPVLLLGLFLVGNVLASILAPDPLQSIRSLAVRIYMVMAWLLLVSLLVRRPTDMLEWLWKGYLAAAIIAVVWAGLEYAGLVAPLPGENHPRARGGFKDPNVYGPFLVPAALYSLRQLSERGLKAYLVFLPLLAAFSVGILLSFSRGAWINFALAMSIFAVLSAVAAPTVRSRLRWVAATLLTALAITVAVSAAVSIEIINERFVQRAVLTQKYDVKQGGRFDTQQHVISRIGRSPLGVGPGRSDEEFGLEPHNLYLHVFVEAGWLAGASFLTFIVLTVRGLTRLLRADNLYRREAILVAASLAGVLVQSLFIDSTHWRHLWLLLAAAWALIIASRGHVPRAPIGYKV